MTDNFANEDIRSIKTEKALFAAMFTLLKKSSFRKITIKGICEEASLSRAAFYAHYIDKYDLLKHWIIDYWPKDVSHDDPYERVEQLANHHINENVLVLKNLILDADGETIDILFEFLISTIDLCIDKRDVSEKYTKNIVLSSFYAGGTLSYMLWQIRNKFPSDVPPMNRYFYDMIRDLQDWQAK